MSGDRVTPEETREWARTPRGKLICPECGGTGHRFFGERSWINKHSAHVVCGCGKTVPASTVNQHRRYHT